MAVLFMDSFSGYATADLPTRWVGNAPSGASIVNTPLPPNSQVGAQVLSILNNFQGLTGNNYGALTRLVMGFRCYKAQVTGSIAYAIHQIGVGSYGLPCGLVADALGTYIVNGSNTVLATGPIIPINEWHHYELDFTFSITGGAVLKVYLDGNPVPFISVSGVNTSFVQAESFSIGGQGPSSSGLNGLQAYFADFYAFSGAGSAPENAALATQTLGGQKLGAPKMAFTVPNGPGRISNWAANGAGTIWQCIDQIPQDGDTTYASSSTVNNAFMVTLGAVPVMSTLIAVQVSNYAREDDAGPRSYQSGFGNGASESYSGVDQFLGGSYNYIQDEYPLNPVTGVQWVPGDLAALQVGLKLTN